MVPTEQKPIVVIQKIKKRAFKHATRKTSTNHKGRDTRKITEKCETIRK